ncbi:hypothetical protein [Anaerorhabdus sp.]|uniref:hypothetical protein n=1 Tax=Anaerorhabdus sp. TaxID=1872524 RepID=UPI002FC5B75F
MNLQYAVQSSSDGLTQVFIIGKEFIGDIKVAKVLGDNFFTRYGLCKRLYQTIENDGNGKGTIVLNIM